MGAENNRHTNEFWDGLERRSGRSPADVELDLMKYKLTSDALNIAMWDADHTKVDPNDVEGKSFQFTWSQEFRHLLGFTDENDFPNLRESWADRIHPEDKEKVADAVKAYFEDRTGNVSYDLEHRLMLKNGQYRYFRTFGKALRNSEGIPLKVAGAIMDIDEKKRMEKALEDALAQSNVTLDYMKNILSKSGAIITVIDPVTHEILFVSDAVRQIVGIEDELAGKTCYEVLQHGKDRRCDFCSIPQLDAEPDSTVVREEHNTLLDRHFQNTSRYFDWPDGRRVIIQHIIDLTDVKRAQKSVEYREHLLDALSQMAIAFLSQKHKTFENLMEEEVKIIADIIDIDRLSVWRNTAPVGDLRATQIYRWEKKSGGNTPPNDIFSNLMYSIYTPSWEKTFKENGVVNGPVSLMPEKEAAALQGFGIVSLFATPVFIDGFPWGFVLFEDHRNERSFSDIHSEFLRSAAFLFVNAVIRAEMEKELDLADKRVRLMLDTAPICCQIWDKNLKTIDCNDAAVKLYKFKNKQEYVERFHTECSPEYQPDGQRSNEKAAELLQKAFAEGECVFDWMHKIPSDGTLMPAEITLVRVEYINDYIVLGYTRDLREHKKMMDAIAVTLFELQEANRAKSDFLSRMSHEMLTPMNAIIGLTHAVKLMGGSDKTKKYLDEIDIASQHLLEQIRDLLDVSEKKGNSLELVHSVFSPTTMFQNALEAVKRNIAEKRLTLASSIDSSIPASLVGDAKRLLQVISHILENAVKFTPEQGEIILSAQMLYEENDAVMLKIEVADNGIGIPKADQSGIFRLFEQADTSLTRKYAGIGLGLPLSRRIVEMMGGKIWVESEPGKGAKFTFTCQLKKVNSQ